MKNHCNICNSKNLIFKKYDRHVLDFSLKGILKRILPYFNSFIPKFLPIIKAIASRKKNGFTGNIILCNNCGYGLMESIPSLFQLKKYYTNDYWTERSQLKPVIFSNKYKKNRRGITQANFVLSNLKNEKRNFFNILEIGAAGAWAILNLRDMLINKKLFLDVCEPGSKWKDYYKNAEINRVSFFFPFKNSKKYHYIHTSHWLEHVRDLNKTINSLYDMISDGGKLFVEVPNTEHYYWNLPTSDTPHIHFFTIKSLNKIFQKAGFKCLKAGEFGITFEDLNNGLVPIHEQNNRGSYIRALYVKN